MRKEVVGMRRDYFRMSYEQGMLRGMLLGKRRRFYGMRKEVVFMFRGYFRMSYGQGMLRGMTGDEQGMLWDE